jgi:hypothetical protein
VKSIAGESRAATWLAAAKHLQSTPLWEDYNVILEVAKPLLVTSSDKAVEDRLDTFLRAGDAHPLFTVAETIFPAAEYRRSGPSGVYDEYPNVVYPAIKSEQRPWGTYALRLVRRRDASGSGQINPLKTCVEKIKKSCAGKGTKHACYELSLTDVAVDLAIYDPAFDRNPHLGGPCLSHVSLKVTSERKLNLTALYRSHHYIARALGNLIGLARLQAFVCDQTGLEAGTLVCVSTFAKLDHDAPSSKTKVRDLLAAM